MAGTVRFDAISDAIWEQMYQLIGNEYGVAGLMGNIWAESGFKPNNLENVGERQFGWTDDSYTQAVNDGTESFTRIYHVQNQDGTYTDRCLGYGICQWTSQGRKQGLWNLKVQENYPIQNINLQCHWLKYELENSYSSTLAVLRNATSVREASDYVLIHFESPYDQSEAVKQTRAGYGQEVYDHYAGSPPPPPPPPPPPTPSQFKTMPIYMMLRY